MGLDYYFAGQKRDKNDKRRESYREPQVLSAQEKVRKRTEIRYRLLPLVILLLAISYLSWWLFLSAYFDVAKIEYLQEPSERIKERIEQLKGRNIITLRPLKLASQWEIEQPSIKALRIYRGLPRTLKVAVEERSKAFVWQTQGKLYLLDASGVVFQEVLNSSDQSSFAIIDDSNVPVQLGQKITSDAFVKTIQEIIDKLPANINGETIASVHVSETIFNLAILTNQNIKILFDTTQPLDLQLEAVKKIYAENRGDVHEYLDVRVLGKAYLK